MTHGTRRGGRVEIFIEAGGPHAKPCVGIAYQERPAVLIAFAGPNLAAVIAGGRGAKSGFATEHSGADNGRTDFDTIFGGTKRSGSPRRRLASDGNRWAHGADGYQGYRVPVHRACAAWTLARAGLDVPRCGARTASEVWTLRNRPIVQPGLACPRESDGHSIHALPSRRVTVGPANSGQYPAIFRQVGRSFFGPPPSMFLCFPP